MVTACSSLSDSTCLTFLPVPAWLSASLVPLRSIAIRSSVQMVFLFRMLQISGALLVLQYLTFTRPDIAYAVQQVCLYMHDPREPHLIALKRILRYIRGTLHMGLLLRPTSTTELTAYSDADWVGCADTRKSISGYVAFLGDNLISWSSKR